MVSDATLAQLASISYSQSGYPSAPAGWTAIQASNQGSNGFTGNAFYSSMENTLVIGYGGTRDTADLVTDAIMAVTGTSSQEAEAVSFARGTIANFYSEVSNGYGSVAQIG